MRYASISPSQANTCSIVMPGSESFRSVQTGFHSGVYREMRARISATMES